MANGRVKKRPTTSPGQWRSVPKNQLRGRVTTAASRLDGHRWPRGVTRAVMVDGKPYPALRVAVAVTGTAELKPTEMASLFSRIDLPVQDLRGPEAPEFAGTAERTANVHVINTSDTPPAEVLDNYRGEWVAMACGEIIDHDMNLVSLGQRLRETESDNDRLFRVPEDLSALAPATLG